MFERYVLAQESKVDAAQKVVQLRDRHQHLKEIKYEDKILKMTIAEMCLEDQAWYGAMQEEIRSRYRQTLSFFYFDRSLDWNPWSC